MGGRPVVELPSGLPDGRSLVLEGRRLGEAIEPTPSPFCAQHGVASEAHFKAAMAARGELTWRTQIGLASVEETIEGLRYLDDLGRKTGMPIHGALTIANWLSGVPPALREKAPRSTSFVLDGLEDHLRISRAAPIQSAFNDWHIGSPYCVGNTIASIQAGCCYHGNFSQVAWDLPLVRDPVAQVAETIKAVGVVSAKREAWQSVMSYPEDGFGGHFLDHASMVGYAMLERYVIEDLCGARFSTSAGGLISDAFTKVAVFLALHEAARSDHPGMVYVHGTTLAPADSYVVQNFGVIAAEYAMIAAAERRYRTGASLMPIPITEKLQVPTPREIGEAFLVAHRAAEAENGVEKFVDWERVEAQRDLLVENGKKLRANALHLLRDSGVDVRDPLQVTLALRQLGPRRLEALCHPAPRDESRPNGIVPFVPTELLRMAERAVSDEVERVRGRGLGSAVAGLRFLVASADVHWFGAYALKAVLGRYGGQVEDLGAERDPGAVVEAAERAGWPVIAVSTHNGQCLAYGARIMELLRARGGRSPVYLGGKLNSILEGDAEPTDVSERLRELGITPCRSTLELFEAMGRQGR
jgi:methylmalonyl-CoA mutase cobalamin-binding subunit